MSMTIEEIKRKYGDEDKDYYVHCQDCPIYQECPSNPALCPENVVGTYDCHHAIKAYLDSKEQPEEPQPAAIINDVVNHPNHYCREGAMECIDEMLLLFGKEAVMHFCLLNAWKYRARALHKNGEQDLQKSDWYIWKYQELKESGCMDEHR